MPTLLPAYLLTATLPFGIALQKLATTIACIWGLSKITKIKETRFNFTLPITLWVWMGCITLYHHGLKSTGAWMLGHIEWWLLPFIVASQATPTTTQLKNMKTILITVTAFLCAIVINQYCFGWRIQGTQIIPAEFRPRGFFSHPLNLAYAAHLAWPWALSQWYYEKKATHALFLFSITTILILTMSRTIQVVTLFSGLWLFMTFVSKKARIKVFIAGIFVILSVLATPNPIGEKFQKTWTVGLDRHSHYTFDRIAFWDVHWTMFLDSPFLGHGTIQDNNTRMPWYEARGLPNFRKPYAAHNMYLQFLVEGGLLAGFLFLLWIGSVFQSIRNIIDRRHYHIFLVTWVGFLIAALTQNAFQDSTVRLCLSLFLCCLIWSSHRTHR